MWWQAWVHTRVGHGDGATLGMLQGLHDLVGELARGGLVDALAPLAGACSPGLSRELPLLHGRRAAGWCCRPLASSAAPVGSPPWIMKPLISLWKIVPSYCPLAHSARKFSAERGTCMVAVLGACCLPSCYGTSGGRVVHLLTEDLTLEVPQAGVQCDSLFGSRCQQLI